MVDGDLRQPSAERRLEVVAPDRKKSLHENFLSQVFHLVRAAQEVEDNRKDPPLVSLHEAAEGLTLAVLALLDPFGFLVSAWLWRIHPVSILGPSSDSETKPGGPGLQAGACPGGTHVKID